MNGTFGIGGQGVDLYDDPPNNLPDNVLVFGPSTGGGGGGGYYGGGGGGAGAGFWGSYGGSGGGGSGFISSLFSLGKMISGSSPMPSYTRTEPMLGNEGHGACRISIFHPLPTCRQIFYSSHNIYTYLFVFIFVESD